MSIRGSDVKSKIQSYVDSADKSKRDIEVNLHKTQIELETITHKKIVLMQAIADTQIDSIISGETARDVTGRIRDVLAQREQEHDSIVAQMDEARERIKQSELEVATNTRMLAEKRTAACAEIAKDESITLLREKLELLGSDVARLSETLDATADECRAKLKPFDQSEAFKHLLGRKFGTADYSGMGPFRLMDKWLAKRIDFDQSRHDYDILQKLPSLAEKRLDEQVKLHRETADDLRAKEYQIQSKFGISDAEGRLRKSEDRLSERRQAISTLQNALNKHLNNTDPLMMSIKESMSSTLAKLSIPTLERMTKATSSLRDEQALDQYKDLTAAEERLKVQEQTLRIRLREASDTFRRAKELRDHFVRSSYDSGNRRFRESFDVSDFINGYIAGSLSQHDIDSQVRNSSTYREPEVMRSSSNSSSAWSTSDRSSSSSSWSTSDSISGDSAWDTSDRF